MVNMVDKPIGSSGVWLLQNDYQQQRTDGMALSTAEWMVQIGDNGFEKSSTMEKYGEKGYVELLKWEGRSSRDVRGLSSSQMLSSASLKHSHVEMHIPIGNYVPDLETKMYNATNIKKITFVRLGNVDGAEKQRVEVQNIVFKNCQIVFFEQSGDVLILAFRFVAKVNTFTAYDQQGKPIGAKVSHAVDFTKGEAGVAK
ncbi:MAG: hypothetical protein WCG04_02435 [Alphaproteobacteria bacterium]